VSNTPRAHDEALKLISVTAPNVVRQGDAGMAGGRDEGPRAEGTVKGRIRVAVGRTAVAGTVRPGAVRLVNCWTVVNMYWLYRKAQCGPLGEHNMLPLKKTS